MRFFIATILLCVLAMFLVPAVITALNPAPPPSPQYLAQQEALDLQNQQDWANFWRVARWAILVLLFTAPLLFLAERYGAQALELVKIRMELRRAQDGEFAMLESREVYIDPQTGKKIKMKTRLMPSRLPTGAVRWNPRTGYWEPATGIDPSIEQEVIMARNASHDTAAAIFPNNEAYIKGIVQGTPRLNGSGMRQVMNPARPPLTQPQEPLALPMKPALLSAKDALYQSTADEWILGQNVDNGSLATFRPSEHTNLGIVGAPGSGKTTCTLMAAMLLAHHYGHQLFILDGKGGADLKCFAHVANWQHVTGDNLREALEPIHNIYLQRRDAFNLIGASNQDEYADLAGQRLPEIFVFIDEFGSILEDHRRLHGLNRDGKEAVAATIGLIGNLMRKGRYVGIHWGIADQLPTLWPPAVLNAMSNCLLSYRLDARQQGIVRENAGNLERGFFMWNNTPFKAVHAQPLVPQLLPPPPKTQPRPVTIQQRPAPPPPVAPAMPVRPAYIYAADTEVIDAEPAPAPAQPAPVQAAPAPAAQHPEVGQAFERTIQEAAGKGLDPKRFEKLVKEWILADPTTRLNSRDPKTGELNGAGATEVADLMAGQDAQQFGGPRSKDDYKSLAHGMLKAARRQIIAGGKIGNQKIGIDRTETIPAAPPPEDPLE